MAVTAGRFYVRVMHDHIFDSGAARCFASTTAVSRHSSSFQKQLAKSSDVAFNSSRISTKHNDIRPCVYSWLLSSQSNLGFALFRRSSFCDVASPWCPHSRNDSCMGMARSFFSSSSADNTGRVPKEGDLPIRPSIDSSTGPKGDIQDGTKDIVGKVNNAIDSFKEAATSTISWGRETKENVLSIINEKLDPSEFMSQTFTHLSYTTFAAVLAWFVMPRLFRRLHRYFEVGQTRLLKRTPTEEVPYGLSFWAALEDPTRILITFVVFSQVGALIAPNTIASHYLGQIWKGGAVVALMWFLYRWKRNVLSRLLANVSVARAERERYLAVDKVSSVGLIILGGMAIAETCGIAVQSVLTVGGIGGVATAFASRDILGNVLSGFALQFSKPFSIGDTIKAGSIEGQVLEIGLTSTSLLDSEKFPVAVPNSFFSSQVIVNKSRAPSHAFTAKIPVHLKDFERISQITQEVQEMLKNHPQVHLKNGPAHCYVSRVIGSSLEITISCNLKRMAKEDLMLIEQEIILEGLKIVGRAGATVGESP